MALNSVGMIKFLIHFTNLGFVQIPVFIGCWMELIRDSREAWGYWVDFRRSVTGALQWWDASFQQSSQPMTPQVTLTA